MADNADFHSIVRLFLVFRNGVVAKPHHHPPAAHRRSFAYENTAEKGSMVLTFLIAALRNEMRRQVAAGPFFKLVVFLKAHLCEPRFCAVPLWRWRSRWRAPSKPYSRQILSWRAGLVFLLPPSASRRRDGVTCLQILLAVVHARPNKLATRCHRFAPRVRSSGALSSPPEHTAGLAPQADGEGKGCTAPP